MRADRLAWRCSWIPIFLVGFGAASLSGCMMMGMQEGMMSHQPTSEGRHGGAMHMVHVIDSSKTVEIAARDLEEAVKRHNFGVLHVYDLKAKLKEKGIDLPNECRILEVCNPKQAAKVLEANMTVSLALPCRIAVYEDAGKTKIGTLLPKALLGVFPGSEALTGVAEEVQDEILQMMQEAK